MDVISLHQAGFTNAVASLGTALTAGHASLIKRYVQEVYLTYDSDDAGTRAALRAVPILREAGISAKVIRMDPYKDPDEFIKNLGAEEFEKRIQKCKKWLYVQSGRCWRESLICIHRKERQSSSEKRQEGFSHLKMNWNVIIILKQLHSLSGQQGESGKIGRKDCSTVQDLRDRCRDRRDADGAEKKKEDGILTIAESSAYMDDRK